MGRLQDRVALITGAAVGIGAASASLFAREGARVALVDLDPALGAQMAERIRGEGGQAVFIQADVSVDSEASRMIESTVSAYGRLDILFNNAGIVVGGSVDVVSEKAWDDTMRIDLKAIYLACRYAVPIMKAQGRGVILNTASVTAIMGVADRAAYSAAKGGVVGLTKAMAMDHIKHGIRVNCLCPGTVDTPSLRQRLAAFPDPEEARRAFIARQPMGRLGQAEDIAYGALYLVSDEAAFVTGVALTIDGGMSL